MARCRAESEGKRAERSSSSAAERDAHAGRVYTNTRSERMVEELKARRFRQIFAYLDQVPCRQSALIRSSADAPEEEPSGVAGMCKVCSS